MALVEAVVSQIGEQVEDGTVEHDFAALEQFVSDRLSEVVFAYSGLANQEDVFRFIEEASGGQIVNLAAINAGVEAEVEGIEGALFTEGRSLVAPLDLSLLAYVQFVL